MNISVVPPVQAPPIAEDAAKKIVKVLRALASSDALESKIQHLSGFPDTEATER